MTLLAENVGYLSISAVFVLAGTEILKKYFAKIDARYICAGLCALAGIVYALGSSFIPPEFLTRISGIAVTTFATSTAIYKLTK